MRTKFLSLAAAVVLAVVAAPAVAAADTYVSPFYGITFAADAKEKAPIYGASVSLLGRSAGLEVEFGYSPNFFGDAAKANVTTLMLGFQAGGNTMGKGVKPYAVVGAGLMRTQIDNSQLLNGVDSNDFGLSIGAGVNAFFTPNVGIRADVRYYRQLQDPTGDNGIPIATKFDYWRH